MRTRTILPILVLLALSALAFGQGTVAMGTPAVTNALGQPMGNASVGIVSVYPGQNPTVPPVANLITLYTDQTLGTQCSGTAGTQPLNNQASPSVGSGCSNPGLADNNGNVVAFSNAGLNWCVFYGNGISTKVQPCMFATGAVGGIVTSVNGRVGAVVLGTSDITPEIAGTGGGTAQAQTVALSPAPASLQFGLQVIWLPIANNSGAGPTLNVNGLGAKTITKLGTAALAANDVTTTALAWAIYDGAEWQLQNPQTAAAGTPSFSQITAGTNAAALVVGTGGSLATSGTGTIVGTGLTSAGWGSPGAIGANAANSGLFTTLGASGASTLHAVTATTLTAGPITSTTANPATTGCFLCVAHADLFKGRNNANGANKQIWGFVGSTDVQQLGDVEGIQTIGPALITSSGTIAALFADDASCAWGFGASTGTQLCGTGGNFFFNHNNTTNNQVETQNNRSNHGALVANGYAGMNGAGQLSIDQMVINTTNCNATHAIAGDLSACISTGSGAAGSTVLNFQGPLAAIVGTGALANIYTFNITGNTVPIGKCVRAKAVWSHSTGTATVTYQWTFGGTNLNSWTSNTTPSTGLSTSVTLCNNGATNVQAFYVDPGFAGTAVVGSSPGFGTAAVDTTANQALSLQFNVANTDQVTPRFWLLELLQ